MWVNFLILPSPFLWRVGGQNPGSDDGDGSNDVIESCNCANSAKGSMPATAAAVPASTKFKLRELGKS